MWIRFKNWRYITDQEQVKVYEYRNQRYYFWKKDEGLCDVRNLEVINTILGSRPDGLPSEYEVAWEKLGIEFDSNGNQIEKATEFHPNGEDKEVDEDSRMRSEADEEVPVVHKRMGRPKGSKNKKRAVHS